ncbi:hypothetical protein Hanom_Chr15g01407381 [Helianthus anomalus]
MYKRSCTLAHGLAQYFAFAYHRQERGLLYGGAYVTVIALSFGYHPETNLLLRPTIHPKRIGMLSLSGMKIVKRFPPDNRKRFKGLDDQPFVSKDLPAQFEPIDPPALLEQVAVHDLEMYIPDLPQPRGPPGAPQFPRQVGPVLPPHTRRISRYLRTLTG